MDSKAIYTTLLPHCKPGYERTLWVYVQFCVDRNQCTNTTQCDNHHIIPKSIEPYYMKFDIHPWNRARLLYRDHFRAHKLLARCIGGKMSYAIWRMVSGHRNTEYWISAFEYERARKQMAKEKSTERQGKTLSDEIRQKMSRAKLGKPRTAQTRQSMSQANQGKTLSDETRQKMSEASLGKPKTDQMRRRLSRTKTGRPRPKITCPHCGKTGGTGVMQRWHFDNCKWMHKN